MFLPCIYTTKCEGYQISATKQMFKELNNESHKMFGWIGGNKMVKENPFKYKVLAIVFTIIAVMSFFNGHPLYSLIFICLAFYFGYKENEKWKCIK